MCVSRIRIYVDMNECWCIDQMINDNSFGQSVCLLHLNALSTLFALEIETVHAMIFNSDRLVKQAEHSIYMINCKYNYSQFQWIFDKTHKVYTYMRLQRWPNGFWLCHVATMHGIRIWTVICQSIQTPNLSILSL